MVLFRNRNRPRTCIDLRVGKTHVVEVLLHMRRADWAWYRANEKVIEEELLLLLESSVLSRMFGEEMEDYHRKMNPHLFADETQIGSRNRSRKASENNAKRKGKKGKSSSAKQHESSELKRPPKEVYFAFGETLQLAYRKEELPMTRSKGGRTLFFRSAEGSADPSAGFEYPQKLSERLLIWCSKIDPKNPTNPDAENVGFLRPDMIPIVSLFREPKDPSEAG